MSEELPYQRLQRHFHEPVRLAILSLLVHEVDGLSFNQLKEGLDLTFGNLDRHLKVLSEAEVVSVHKITGKGRPLTMVSLSDVGRVQFLEYLDSLEIMLRQASQSVEERRSSDELGGALPSEA